MILIDSEHLSGKLAPPGRPTRAPVMFSRWNFRAALLGLLTLFIAKATLIEGALPGFTSANWVGLGGTEMLGTFNPIYALAVDNDGNVYVGGGFHSIGGVLANYIAKWNGTAWSALGSGMNGTVRALTGGD